MRLDLSEFCSDELKKEISEYRDKIDKQFETEMDVDGEAEKKKTALECVHSGVYELCGVVTHKGRYANSGHYIGWTKDSKSDDWFKFDDDVVTKVKSEEISALSGGGDWHMAYILFYRAAPWRTRK
jgi:ubiquitin carboxyl-terminal hydrolase 14